LDGLELQSQARTKPDAVLNERAARGGIHACIVEILERFGKPVRFVK
jgi:hypothetical protein